MTPDEKRKEFERRAGWRRGPAQPSWTKDGIPCCSDACTYHDGRRCEQTGFRAGVICEPVAVELSRAAGCL